MNSYDANTPVGTIVTDRPGRSRFFERLGFDYCCGGKTPIGDACAEKGLNVISILASLEAFEAAAGDASSDIDLRRAGNEELIRHIIDTHHEYLRNELPRLEALSAKVRAGHGDREPRLVAVDDEFTALRCDLVPHLDREENELFPLLTEEIPDAEAIGLALHDLEQDHDRTGEALQRLYHLTDGYTVPEWGCNTFRAFYDGLHELEMNIHEHVHKENNVLFSRFAPATAKAE